MAENTADQEVSTAFLVLDGAVVYEVAPNSVLNIGRLDSNDIILDDYKVSREHAVLKYSGTDFMVVDLASTQGTFLNGQRVDRGMANFGDKIQIVSHEISLNREMPRENEEGDSITIPKMARSLDRRLKFFGGLNEFALITLVQFLHQEKQSGLLLLELGQKPGPRIYFQDGQIIHVSEGENLAELLVRQNHEQSLFFYFHHETHFPERTIDEPTPNYLMNLIQSHDEQKHEEASEKQPEDVLDEPAVMGTTERFAITSRLEAPPPIRR